MTTAWDAWLRKNAVRGRDEDGSYYEIEGDRFYDADGGPPEYLRRGYSAPSENDPPPEVHPNYNG